MKSPLYKRCSRFVAGSWWKDDFEVNVDNFWRKDDEVW
jgi:hypothetical protein